MSFFAQRMRFLQRGLPFCDSTPGVSRSLREDTCPPSIDEYLIDRLAYCEGKPEQTGIIDFQIRQGSGRWGDSASRVHETLPKEMITNIMNRLDGISNEDAVNETVFIESLRRENTLGKGGFTEMWTYSDSTYSLNRPAVHLLRTKQRPPRFNTLPLDCR